MTRMGKHVAAFKLLVARRLTTRHSTADEVANTMSHTTWSSRVRCVFATLSPSIRVLARS